MFMQYRTNKKRLYFFVMALYYNSDTCIQTVTGKQSQVQG